MKTKSLAIVALLGLLASSQTGCAPDEAAAASSWRESVAVQVAAVAMASPDTPTPDDSPDSGEKCSNCKGTGSVPTGDGISTTECDECEGTGVTAVGVNRDDLLSRVYDLPKISMIALDEDGPPMRVQAADGGWRMMETPGQALAMAPPSFQSSLVPEDAAPYPAPEDQLAEVPVSQVAPQPVPSTQPVLPAGPVVCEDGTCTIQAYSGVYVNDGCATCGAGYSAPATCGECGRPIRNSARVVGRVVTGGGPIARAWAEGDGPIRRAFRGEGPIVKAFRSRRGMFRRHRGC